jgi:hypothetical protein
MPAFVCLQWISSDITAGLLLLLFRTIFFDYAAQEIVLEFTAAFPN